MYVLVNIFFIFRLLDVLAARKDPKGLSGAVLIDGAPQPENFRLCSGYVVQVSIAWYVHGAGSMICLNIFCKWST